MRETLLRGSIGLPNYQAFSAKLGRYYASAADKMFTAMWYAYLKNKGTISLVYWSERFDNAEVFNTVLLSLSDAGWITCHSIPARNWAEASLNESKLLEYCTSDELESIRAHNKFKQYRLVDDASTKATATRLNGKVTNTGLTREGFMAAGNTRFSYDQNYMEQYSEPIRKNLTKSMDKIALMYPDMQKDRASYDTISSNILDYHLVADETFTRGNNYNDSRGRAISSALGKVFNPISSKDARALLCIV